MAFSDLAVLLCVCLQGTRLQPLVNLTQMSVGPHNSDLGHRNTNNSKVGKRYSSHGDTHSDIDVWLSFIRMAATPSYQAV